MRGCGTGCGISGEKNTMVQTIIDEIEILETIKTRVGSNGQISVGKKHAGKEITAYIVLSQGSKTPIARQ